MGRALPGVGPRAAYRLKGSSEVAYEEQKDLVGIMWRHTTHTIAINDSFLAPSF